MANRRHRSRAAFGAALAVFSAPWAGPEGLAGVAWAEPAAPAAMEKLDLVTAGGVVTLDVEIADTPAKQAVGLMYRTALPERHGMLFLHDPPRDANMWMRNTYIPLDMVFIAADGTVTRIAAMTEPHSEELIASNGPVAAVLEIAGGTAAKLGLKAGDKIRHRHFGTSAGP